MIEKLNCMKIMEFKSEHWLMVLCWGELDNEKKNLRRNGTEFTQKCFDIVSLVSMDCFQYFLPFSWEFQGLSNILFVCNIFIWTIKCILLSGNGWKVALQIVGLKFYKNAKKSSIYSQSLLICVHKTPVVENHLTTWEINEIYYSPGWHHGETCFIFRWSISSFTYRSRQPP